MMAQKVHQDHEDQRDEEALKVPRDQMVTQEKLDHEDLAVQPVT